MKIAIFRVDASSQIGSGHVMRCLNLANVLKTKNVRNIFICRACDGDLIPQISEKFEVFSLDYLNISKNNLLGCSQEEDAEETIKALNKNKLSKFNYLIIDHYGLDIVWEEKVQNKFKNLVNNFRCLVIDDFNDRNHRCDIFLDQNIIEMNKFHRSYLSSDKKILYGPYFSLLSKEYSYFKNQLKSKKKIKKILIFFGGVDKNKLTLRVLKILSDKKFKDLIFEVVIGTNNKEKTEIRNFCLGRKNFNLHIQIKSLAQLLSNIDLAVGAGGTSAWERECLRVPSLLISLSRNQKNLIKYIINSGRIIYLGHFDKVSDVEIKESIVDQIKDYSLNNKRGLFIDGLGANRVALLITGLNNSIKFRKVNKNNHSIINYWKDIFSINESIVPKSGKYKEFVYFVSTKDNCDIAYLKYYIDSNNIINVELIFDFSILFLQDMLQLYRKSILFILKGQKNFLDININYLNKKYYDRNVKKEINILENDFKLIQTKSSFFRNKNQKLLNKEKLIENLKILLNEQN